MPHVPVTLLLLAFVLAMPASALVHLADFDTPGRAMDVALLGDAVLVADGSAGLRVVDLANPAAPVEIGSLPRVVAGFATVVAVEGTRAYLGESGGGVSVIDVSDPTAPVRLSNRAGLGHPRDLAPAGDHLFVSTNLFPGFYVLDVADPAAPVVATLPLGGAGEMTLHGTLLYTDAGIIDVANPLAPVLVTTSFFAGRLAIEGALGATKRPVGVDLADPLAPATGPDGAFVTSAARDVALTGSLAWLPYGGNIFGLVVADVSDLRPLQPLLSSVVPPWSGTGAFDVEGTIAVGAGAILDRVGVLDVSDPAAPVALGMLDVDREFKDLDLVGTHVYGVVQTGATAGLRILDVSDPATPVQIGAAPLPTALRVVAEGGRVYVLTTDSPPSPDENLHVYDVSNPAAPVPIGSYVGPDPTVQEMDVEGTTVYLATNNLSAGALVILDAANPAAITEIARVPTDGVTTGVRVVGARAYVTSNQLDVFDVSTPAAPVLVTSFDILGRSFRAPRPSGDRLYVVAGSQVVTLDFSDPVAPRIVGATPTISIPIRAVGTLVFQANNSFEISDVSAPSGIGPLWRGNGPSLGDGVAIAVDPDRELAVLARDGAGIAIADLSATLAAWECANGRDDDGDGLADASLDPGCRDRADPSERFDCGDGLDDDGDGQVDFPADTSCASAAEASESPACDDGTDDDGDGLVDFGADPGCKNRASERENPKCQNGHDDDGDGKFDFDGGASANSGVALGLADPHCTTAYRDKEAPNTCGLGVEILFGLSLRGALRRRLHTVQ